MTIYIAASLHVQTLHTCSSVCELPTAGSSLSPAIQPYQEQDFVSLLEVLATKKHSCWFGSIQSLADSAAGREDSGSMVTDMCWHVLWGCCYWWHYQVRRQSSQRLSSFIVILCIIILKRILPSTRENIYCNLWHTIAFGHPVIVSPEVQTATPLFSLENIEVLTSCSISNIITLTGDCCVLSD